MRHDCSRARPIRQTNLTHARRHHLPAPSSSCILFSHLEDKVYEDLPPQQQQGAAKLLTHAEVAKHERAHAVPPGYLQDDTQAALRQREAEAVKSAICKLPRLLAAHRRQQ